MESSYRYIIVGGGLAGASAVDGIRELDKDGTILLLSQERRLPYHRPPLSKQLWTGKKKVRDIFVHDGDFYRTHGVDMSFGVAAVGLDAGEKRLVDSQGRQHRYDKLLLATGAVPRKLPVPGADLHDVCYFRTLDDFVRCRELAEEGKTAVVIGSGFIGSEMAAALTLMDVHVTMLYPGTLLAGRVLPPSVSRAVQDDYRTRGVTLIGGDQPSALGREGSQFVTRTRGGRTLTSDVVVVGIGVLPDTAVAEDANLTVQDGVVVNEYLQSSHPDVFAAGDIASFPYQALHKRTRVEHWDNAMVQGKQAGRNMAGAHEVYTHMPYFFSDLFDFGYEAVGDVDTRLEVRADWQEENKKGTLYYLKDGKVQGALMCNVWDKVEAARTLIRAGAPIQEVIKA